MDACGWSPAVSANAESMQGAPTSGKGADSPVSAGQILESLPDAALVFDRDGVIMMANRACVALLGETPTDVVGRAVWEFLPPGMRAAQQERRAEALEGAGPSPTGRASVVVAQRSDGSTFATEFSVSPLVTRDGPDPAAGLAILREVAPAIGSMGGARHHTLAERAVRMGTWEVDARSGAIHWSAGVYDLLGVPPDAVAPSNEEFLQRVHPADLPLLLQRQSEVRAAGGEFFAEVRINPAYSADRPVPEPGSDDAWVPVTILGRVDLDDQGAVRWIAGTVQDASAHLSRERDLHVVNSRLQHAFDAAPFGMSLIDARPGTPLRRLTVNRTLGDLLGLTDDEMLSRPLMDSIDARDRAEIGQALAGLRNGETDVVRSLQTRLDRPDGQERWVDVNGALVRDASGSPDYIVASMVDVTGLVRSEEKARAAERVLAAALDANPDGFAVYRILTADADLGPLPGPRFQLIRINAAGAAMSTSDQTLVGLTLEEILDDPEGSGIAGLLRRAVTDSGTHRLRTAYASKGWSGVLDVVAVRIDEDHVLSTWRDVTAQVTSENVLIEAYSRAQHAWDTLHLALDAATDAILILELDPATPAGAAVPTAVPTAVVIRYLNPVAAASMSGDRDDLFDTDLATSLPAWQHTALPDAIREVAATGAPRTCRTVVDGPNGPTAPPLAAFEATVSRLGDNRVIVISRDVLSQETTHRRLEESRRAAERSAAHDPLTGLPNRAHLERRLRHALMTCTAEERVAVLFCDLDDLKAVNDTHGHRAGDLLLKSVALRLRACVQDDQTASRISGDEFVLVLPGLTPGWQPADTVDRVRRAVERPVDLDGAPITPTLTIGSYLADPGSTVRDRDPADVLAAADRLMYDAKSRRRTR